MKEGKVVVYQVWIRFKIRKDIGGFRARGGKRKTVMGTKAQDHGLEWKDINRCGGRLDGSN